jgi:hypothetical protein
MMLSFCALAFCTAKYNKPYAGQIYPSALLLGCIYAPEPALHKRNKILWKVCGKFENTLEKNI